MYTSDTTRFIRELLEKNPQIGEQRKRNRLTWWDRPQDLERWRANAESTVPQPGYVYFPLPGNKEPEP
jgi:hypothetical protein